MSDNQISTRTFSKGEWVIIRNPSFKPYGPEEDFNHKVGYIMDVRMQEDHGYYETVYKVCYGKGKIKDFTGSYLVTYYSGNVE